MKKKFILIIGIFLGSILIIISAYRLSNVAPSERLTTDQQMKKIMESSNCLMCHSQEPTLPFYAKLPIFKNLFQKTLRRAIDEIDLQPAYDALCNGRPVDQVSLTKMERAMTLGAMPPTDFCIMHWGAAISDKEKKRVAHWAYDHRIKHYYNGLACEQHQNEPIQPIPDSIEINYRKAALGNLLYHDTRLSIDNTLSCADCHALNTAGVDNQDFSDGVNGHIGTANAPTVFNSVFNFVQFWDGRALTLAEQAVAPPINPIEMGSTDWNMIVNKLKKDKALATMFTEVYPEGFSESTITDAIGEFEKSLITPNSHFDRYLKGDQNAISQFELEGYQLFKDNECVSCHVGVNVGGLSYEKLGLTRNYFTDRGTKIMEDDLGRFKQTKHERDRHRFKVPGLRNVVLTYPYFHDGKMITLEDAIDHMAKYQINKDLSKEEISKIKAFLNTLTGEYNGKLLENDSLKKQ